MTRHGIFVGLEITQRHYALAVVSHLAERDQHFYFLDEPQTGEIDLHSMIRVINEYIKQLTSADQTSLVINSTFLGKPMRETVKARLQNGADLRFLRITTEENENLESDPWRVPILDIGDSFRSLSQTSHFRLSDPFSFDIRAQALLKELNAFQLEPGDLIYPSPRIWGQGENAKSVIAVLLACWAAHRLSTP